MTFTLKKWLCVLFVPLFLMAVLVGSLLYALLSNPAHIPVVKTKGGSIQGLIASDGDYDMYLGVPYAYVDENNVFGPANIRRKSKKVFKAFDDSIICPQFEEFNKTITGSLDCLRLNIYVPHSAIKTHVPVLVFIHGGDYQSGFGGRQIYGPKNFMKHDIIVVTVNFRLGPYGFLCVDIPDISGNQGLKDQILALKWIRDNIEYFGGRADQVTVAGAGSGGENVNLHLLYGREPLFQRVIIESGIYLNQFDDEDGIESVPIEMADNLGFETNNEIEAMTFLRKKDPHSVIASSIRLHLEYGPCIERNISGVRTFITNNTYSATDKIKTIPILISQSNNALLQLFGHRNLDNIKYRDIFRDDLVEHFKLESLKDAEMSVRKFYIGKEKVGESVKDKIIDFKSDLYHNFPTKRMIDTYLKRGVQNIYYGVFTYSGASNFVKKIYNITGDGATKNDVLGYLFDIPFIAKPISENDQLVTDLMTTLWANFVKYGNPTPVKSELLPVKWEPVSEGKLNYLEISTDLKSKVTPFQNRTEFWELFYKQHVKQERTTKLIEPWKY